MLAWTNVCAAPAPIQHSLASLIDGATVKNKPPPREAEYVTLIETARQEYSAARGADGRRDARVNLQIKTHEFMGLTHEARGWFGAVLESGITVEGRRSLKVEIAPGVTVATVINNFTGDPYRTLIAPNSPISATIGGLAIGQTVIFDADLIGQVLGTDDDMILQPQLLARFTALRKMD
jgi:hypothetical protein